MEIIGYVNESTYICINNSKVISQKKNPDSNPDTFKQLYILNLNDTHSNNVGNKDCKNVEKSLPLPAISNYNDINLKSFVLLPIPITKNDSKLNVNTQILQVSVQQLNKNETTVIQKFNNGDVSYSLMSVVFYHHVRPQQTQQQSEEESQQLFNNNSKINLSSYYSTTLYLLETTFHDTFASANKTIIIDKYELIKKQNQNIHVHILPTDLPIPKSSQPGFTGYCETPTTPSSGTSNFIQSFIHKVLVLQLQECITIYKIEATPNASNLDSQVPTTIKILSIESIPKYFSWAQWNPTYQFLAFTHKQKLKSVPAIEDYNKSPITIHKKVVNKGDNSNCTAAVEGAISGSRANKIIDMGILSVYQFHSNYPRESVLNFPLPKYEEEILTTKQEFFKPIYTLTPSPFVLTNLIPNQQQQLRIVAHSSGLVYLFQLLPPPSCIGSEGALKYNVNILHHNKTITGQVSNTMNLISIPINVDVCMVMNGHFLVVLGWPLFIHVLDIGIDHEPSHHLIFNVNTLQSFLPLTIKEPSSISLLMSCSALNFDESSVSLSLIFNNNCNNNNLQVQHIEINSSLLLPLIKGSDVQFKLNTLHYLLVHLNDINAAKRMIYDAGQVVENIWLHKLFQEFIVGNSYNQTKKQLLPSVKRFLHLLPYCPFTNMKDTYEGLNYKMDLKPSLVQVSTMLLSPNQRIFPHTVRDLWTTLWELNEFLTKNKRFSHKTIADKLLISLQCYKPEVLSRATTPMSPSSPMIWSVPGAAGIINSTSTSTTTTTNDGSGNKAASNNNIDLSSPFGKRMSEFQLPFIEHESCTANKQEFIYSINLRELSMHLLKERKDCPVAGHTIGGKYVNALVDTSRHLCHLICTIVHLHQPVKKSKDKGFRLIDSLNWDTKLRLFLLFEHFSLGMATLACPLPNGFSSFFAYLGYRVLQYDQFLWHVRSGSFELQIDLIKQLMTDMNDGDKLNVEKKLHLISLLSKSRASRVLNGWSHPKSICIRARQHASDLLSGNIISNSRKTNSSSSSTLSSNRIKLKGESSSHAKGEVGPLDTFFKLLSAKANQSDIDLPLLTEATMLSMNLNE